MVRKEHGEKAPPNCDACGSTTEPLQVSPNDSGVRICVAEGPCIARAQAAGTWRLS